MNKVNKIYCVAVYKGNGRDIYVAQINNSSLGLSEKDITCIFPKTLVQEWCDKMLGWYCFSMKKLETWIYIHSVVLVKNSYGESWDSSCEKYSVPVQKQWVPDEKNIQVCNWKCSDLRVTRQLIWLISLTDSKTLYYRSTLKLKYSPSKG